MFPLQPSDELAYQILFHPRQQNMISQDLIFCPLLDTSNHCHNNVNNCSSSRKRKQSATSKITHPEKRDGDENDGKLKKILHRDMERQRRKEMATLYASLRSLLPLECVKKKRSVSDHMHEAVNYIKQMHNNLKELERRRDSISHADAACSSSNTNTTPSPGYVSVSRCRDGGLEILVQTGCKLEETFPLSTLLRTLLNEGVEVVSCVSTKTTHARVLHRLHSKVCGEICVDVRALQQKLSAVINPSGLDP